MIWYVITPREGNTWRNISTGSYISRFSPGNVEIKATKYNTQMHCNAKTTQYKTPHDNKVSHDINPSDTINATHATRLYIISRKYACLTWSCGLLEHP